ncbi:MAG: phosphoribosylformylglycinamidine synthase subunit PurL [Bacteroidota bacterium]
MNNSVIAVEPNVDLPLAESHGLTKDEFDRILSLLGRTPTYTELGIYSVMWSEHCSYKNSIAVIKTLPRSGGRLLVGAGEENAGLVDIGDGLAVAFKIESHNHPSAVEPYQGAATGVGGILRDIFTMGARPIAALNSLRFGPLDTQRSKYLFRNVVKGIGDYGNSFGVPTVGGEIYFEECYKDNPLVNAMAVGIVAHNQTASAVALGPGNPVMIVGSATGRDGIHGATFASEEISAESESKRPSVQVGDPFTEKLLLEATLEAIRSGFIVGIQDMGAAGLTCSSTEMSAKGKVGMDLHLEKVPVREDGMSAYEIMLSESQERMLLVAKKGHEGDVANIFNKWDLSATVIGSVKEGGRVRVYHYEELKADVPAASLVLGEGAPVYVRDKKEPAYLQTTRTYSADRVEPPADYLAVLRELLRSTSIASKRWVYQQYDTMVRTNTVEAPGGDAAIVRLKGSKKALSLSTDCNARYVYLNPRRGGQIAVAEAARNVVCTGARPIGITNCLNFGNPYDPEVYWQFSEAVAGIGEACRALGTPVTGGNVSFYNESPESAVYPTPVIGMVGLLDDVEEAVGCGFRAAGDVILLLGSNKGEIGGSEYLRMRTGQVIGDIPGIDLKYEKAVHESCLELSKKRLLRSAHDVSDGGIAVSIAESCFAAQRGLGAAITEEGQKGIREDFWLFGEGQSMIVVSVAADSVPEVRGACGANGIDMTIIGKVTKDGLIQFGNKIMANVESLREDYETAIKRAMQ